MAPAMARRAMSKLRSSGRSRLRVIRGRSTLKMSKELMSTYFTRMDGYKKMVWTVGHMDRNHWLPEDPINAPEVYVANQYREINPDAVVRLIVWDPPMTHYGHLELPKEKAAADYSVIRWLVK